MSVRYNHKEYFNYISNKYTTSKKIYKRTYDDKDDPLTFPVVYESMNVYPIYPVPIIMPLKKKNNKYDFQLVGNSKLSMNINILSELSQVLYNKLDEFDKYVEKFKKFKMRDKIRRFFDYEIRDKLNQILDDRPKITNAWVKMYELLSTYRIFENTEDQILNTFHICEHPGAFIFAIKKYIKMNIKKKHKFIYQSLKPDKPNIFRPNKILLDKYPHSLDYGPKNTGDITDNDNIRYYYNKYKNTKFNLITSDCGMDFAEKFKMQENELYKIFLGALITAIGLSTFGSNYIFKLFSFNEKKTIELLYIACMFYERVDLVRTLTTKSGSGEMYCVCLNYNYKASENSSNINKVQSINDKFDAKNKKHLIDKLISYMNNDKTFLLNKIDDKFIKRIINNHKLITLRRLTNINMLLFRLFNIEYIDKNPKIKIFVKHFVEYYVKYFISYLGFDNIKENKPLKINATFNLKGGKKDMNIYEFINKLNKDIEKYSIKEADKKFYFQNYLEPIYNNDGFIIESNKKNKNDFNIVHIGGNYKHFVKLWDNDEFLKKYNKHEKKVIYLNEHIANRIMSYKLYNNVKDYIIKKYDVYNPVSIIYSNKSRFINKSNVNLQKFEYKKSNLLVTFSFRHKFILKYISNIISLVYKLIDGLDENYSFILRIDLPLHIKQFYNFIQKLTSMFDNVILFSPIIYQKRTIMGYIILKNKNNNNKNNEFHYKDLVNYYSKINEYAYNEQKLYIKMLKLYVDNEDAFYVIRNKYLSNTFFKFI